MKMFTVILGLLALNSFQETAAQGEKEKGAIIREIDEKSAYYADIAQKIWDYAEVGYLEFKSSELLQETLRKEGFEIEKGVAGIPTAFVATYGSQKPVVSLLAEYDALPGLAQEAVPFRKVIEGQKAGHACGHHLFGTGSVAAAIAVKNWLKQTGKPGTIKVIGSPAEEGGSGKVFLVREGIFSDTDVAMHWHPSDQNIANPLSALANISGKIRFRGVSAHAASAPERGRSALDGVEALNYMINLMREHVPSDARIHYVITKGGEAPNVVPDFAEGYYYARHNNRDVVRDIWSRIVKAAEGAALGTGTTAEVEIIGGTHDILPVEGLAEILHSNLQKVGGVEYTPEEEKFAAQISETLGAHFGSILKKPGANTVQPFSAEAQNIGGSTDVGDVSWVVPTVGLRTATWVPGTPAHSWQAVAAGGTSIGTKGMVVAAKAMAITLVELFSEPDIVDSAKKEWLKARGESFQYKPLLGDRAPALDYRK